MPARSAILILTAYQLLFFFVQRPRRGHTVGYRSILPLQHSVNSYNALYAAERREAAVNGDDAAGDEDRGGTDEPEQRPNQVVWLSQPTRRCVRQYRLTTRRIPSALGIGQQEAILLRQEKARCQGIHANKRTVFLRHMDRQPLRKIDDRRFGRAIGGDTRERLQRVQRGDIDDAAVPAFGHDLSENLATEERPGKVQVEHILDRLRVQIEEGALLRCCCQWSVAASAVDQNIQGTIGAHDPLLCSDERGVVGNITGKADSTSSLVDNLPGDLLAGLSVEAEYGNVGPGLRQSLRHCASQHSASTCYNSCLALDIEKRLHIHDTSAFFLLATGTRKATRSQA